MGSEEGADGIFAPLRQATFRKLWLSSTVLNTGSLIQGVGAAWAMASISTPDHVALVQTATFLPVALLALPAGALADIYDRRKVQIASLSLALVCGVLMTLASLLGYITPWVLLAFCFLDGGAGALTAPARGTSVGEQVPKNLLPQWSGSTTSATTSRAASGRPNCNTACRPSRRASSTILCARCSACPRAMGPATGRSRATSARPSNGPSASAADLGRLPAPALPAHARRQRPACAGACDARRR